MSARRLGLRALVVAACALGGYAVLGAKPAPVAPVTPAPSAQPEATLDVRFRSGRYELRGLVMRPAGAGTFPVLVYNHGSERDPSPEFFGDLGRWFEARGFVVFFPYRRGSSGSEGPYWEDAIGARASDREQAVVEQLDQQSDDVLAAIAWIRTQPYADPGRVSVAGCSFGGIETVLAAERAPNVRAAVDFAGASMSWAGSPPLQDRMRRAVKAARAPIFFLQAQNDFDTTPSLELAAEMDRAHLPHAVHVFPPHGQTRMAGHAHFCNHGMAEWGPEVLGFLSQPPSP